MTLLQPGFKRKKFALLETHAVRYLSFAGKTLKEVDPFLMHVICVAHLQHHCTMRARDYLKNINEVTATIKNKNGKKIFMKLVCRQFVIISQQDGQRGLTLHCTRMSTFPLFVLLSTMNK